MAEHRPAGSRGPSPSPERSTHERDTASEMITQGSEITSAYSDQGREQIEHAGQYLEEHIRDKPLESVVLAAGLGVVLGLLWKR
jgi:ElaB/YqjD/DUF883 family membrane-anchored ribosome-binding protein